MCESGLAIVCVGENCLEGQEVRHLENCEGRDCITKKCGNLGSRWNKELRLECLQDPVKKNKSLDQVLFIALFPWNEHAARYSAAGVILSCTEGVTQQ